MNDLPPRGPYVVIRVRFVIPLNPGLNFPVGLFLPTSRSKAPPTTSIMILYTSYLVSFWFCFGFRLLYRAGCFYIIFCHYSFIYGLYYAAYGVTFACVEDTNTTLVRECSLLDGSLNSLFSSVGCAVL